MLFRVHLLLALLASARALNLQVASAYIGEDLNVTWQKDHSDFNVLNFKLGLATQDEDLDNDMPMVDAQSRQGTVTLPWSDMTSLNITYQVNAYSLDQQLIAQSLPFQFESPPDSTDSSSTAGGSSTTDGDSTTQSPASPTTSGSGVTPPATSNISTSTSSPIVAAAKSNTPVIVGSVVGAILGLALLFLLVFLLLHRQRKREKVQFYKQKMVARGAGSPPPTALLAERNDIEKGPYHDEEAPEEELPAYGYSNFKTVEKADPGPPPTSSYALPPGAAYGHPPGLSHIPKITMTPPTPPQHDSWLSSSPTSLRQVGNSLAQAGSTSGSRLSEPIHLRKEISDLQKQLADAEHLSLQKRLQLSKQIDQRLDVLEQSLRATTISEAGGS